MGLLSADHVLLSEFLMHDGTQEACDTIIEALAGGRNAAFEFDRFEITLLLSEQKVRIEDVLDASKAGEDCVPLPVFEQAVHFRRAGYRTENGN